MKVLTIFGTRPEAIKLAPVVRELARCSGEVTSRVCVTGQHRHMLDQVLTLFGIVPDYDLNLMRTAQSPTCVAAAILSRLPPILAAERPDWVVVQGDTTTAMAAAVTAAYAQVKVAHVEAGLRTNDKAQPFPEEINRRLIGAGADLHFAPSPSARANLLREGVPDEQIVVSGNPVIDALSMVLQLPCPPPADGLAGLSPEKPILLTTVHRRENFNRPLRSICEALRAIAARFGDRTHILFPVHLNPCVREPVYEHLQGVPGITLMPPLDYLPFVHLLRRCYLVLTDSGGLQEEAPSLGIPVLVLRNTTERPEAVEAGTVRLTGLARAQIVREVTRLLQDEAAYRRMAQAVNPYGDGRAAARIVAALRAAGVPASRLQQEG